MVEADFLREICARLHDPVAYGVFADWLEDRGDPRAEYARVCGELAGICGEEPRFHEIVRRAQGKPSSLLPDNPHHQALLQREQDLTDGLRHPSPRGSGRRGVRSKPL